MHRIILYSISCTMLMLSFAVYSQSKPMSRLPVDVLNIAAPSSRVLGAPGNMQFQNRECSSLPIREVRTRIINTVTQEWAYFGFNIQDQTVTPASSNGNSSGRRRRPRISPVEALRVADSIAGYWAATPDSGWILQRQNNFWNSSGMGSRWRDPWSAAFISWVMCESGLGDTDQFDRAMAHHQYIDQAILARDSGDSRSAYIAFEPGEKHIIPGDMLCRGSRPAYQSIAERRQHLGEGARTHCDIVVKLDETQRRIMVIGGNVRGTVGMKLLPATLNSNGLMKPAPYSGRRIFAHLKLNADPIADDALDHSATFKAISCSSMETPQSILTATINPPLTNNC